MPVSLERTKGKTWVLRAGPSHQQLGDSYEASGTVEMEGDCVTVKGFGVSAPLSLSEYAQMREWLRSLGAKKLLIERRKEGKVTMREYNL